MIRKAVKTDAEAIAEICRSSLGHDGTAEVIAERIGGLRNSPSYYIAVFTDESGAVCGFLQAQEYTPLYEDNGWNVIALAVAPASRGKGIGRALMSSLETHAKSLGGHFVRLNSRTERTEAHAFYEHIGYTCDKTQKRFIKRF